MNERAKTLPWGRASDSKWKCESLPNPPSADRPEATIPQAASCRGEVATLYPWLPGYCKQWSTLNEQAMGQRNMDSLETHPE